jgi:hypothetical protein
LGAYWKIRAAPDPAIAFNKNKIRTKKTFRTKNSSNFAVRSHEASKVES